MIRVEINETENMNRDTETSEDQKLDFFFLINKTDRSKLRSPHLCSRCHLPDPKFQLCVPGFMPPSPRSSHG